MRKPPTHSRAPSGAQLMLGAALALVLLTACNTSSGTPQPQKATFDQSVWDQAVFL
ncbi:outer membrane biogenesis lipoprotein LolB [Deinococcus metalli]|nr:hypothetical protein [Deinococcus metalli]MBB5376488.1 outer membrane biogenesis lipoprotein LolB [Deinococcus metalli]